MDGKFTLEIGMGNSAMRSSESLALALEAVAKKIRDPRSRMLAGAETGKIRDDNGNTVGAWHYVEDK